MNKIFYQPADAQFEIFIVSPDGKIDLKDIAEAQRYYQAKTGDENWTKAQTADVNGDGVVDIQDYIALFHAVVDAMGW